MKDANCDPTIILRDWYKDTKEGEAARRFLMECDHPEMFDKYK